MRECETRGGATGGHRRGIGFLLAAGAAAGLTIALATACAAPSPQTAGDATPVDDAGTTRDSEAAGRPDFAVLTVDGHMLEVGSSRIADVREAFGEYMPTLDEIQEDADEGYVIRRDVDPGSRWKVSFKWRGARVLVSGRNETDKVVPIDDLVTESVQLTWDGPGNENCGAYVAGLGFAEPVLREAAEVAKSAGGETGTDGTEAHASWDAQTPDGRDAKVSLRLWAGEKPIDYGDAKEPRKEGEIEPAENREEAFLRDILVELA